MTMDYVVDSQGVKYQCKFLGREGMIAEVDKLERGHSSNIVIPSEINGPASMIAGKYKVVSVGQWAFSDSDTLRSVELPDSITEIHMNAFENCYSLISVKLPNSIKKIGSETFYNCKSLKSIVLPDYLGEIKESTFNFCENLEYVRIGDFTQHVDETAFRNCYKLREVIWRWHKGRSDNAQLSRELRAAVPILCLRTDYE